MFVLLSASHQEVHDTYLSYSQWCWLKITCLRWTWPDFSTVKFLFFPVKLIKDTLWLCKLSCFSLYYIFPYNCWHLGLCFLIGQNEVKFYNEWTVDSKIFTLKDPFIILPPALDLTFWKLLPTRQTALLKVYVAHFPMIHSSDTPTALCAHEGRACFPHTGCPELSTAQTTV